eukprot:88511-Pleurochrysis_carterae.AAC.7
MASAAVPEWASSEPGFALTLAVFASGAVLGLAWAPVIPLGPSQYRQRACLSFQLEWGTVVRCTRRVGSALCRPALGLDALVWAINAEPVLSGSIWRQISRASCSSSTCRIAGRVRARSPVHWLTES